MAAKKKQKATSHKCKVGLIYNAFYGGYPVKCKICGTVGYGHSSVAATALASEHLKRNWM